jgi:hypothetical protein
VNILRVGKRYERLCGDLLPINLRKCTLGKMETLIHRHVIESPTCDKDMQPLYSVNCYDSYAHGHERHRTFT